MNDLNFNSVLLMSKNPEVLSDFYGKVFEKSPDMEDGGYFGYLVGKAFLTIGPHDKIKGDNKQPERFMINFESEDVQKEFERIKDLGAEVVAQPYKMGGMNGYIATFSDPDGNYFQLLPPWKE